MLDKRKSFSVFLAIDDAKLHVPGYGDGIVRYESGDVLLISGHTFHGGLAFDTDAMRLFGYVLMDDLKVPVNTTDLTTEPHIPDPRPTPAPPLTVQELPGAMTKVIRPHSCHDVPPARWHFLTSSIATLDTSLSRPCRSHSTMPQERPESPTSSTKCSSCSRRRRFWQLL